VPELAKSPRLFWRLSLVGVVLALLLVALRIMAISRRGAAWGLALYAMAWSLLCGLIGVILMLAWTATLHVFWARNENLLQLSPLSLVLVVLVPMALLSGRQRRAARLTAVAVLAIASVGLLLSAIPGGQENRAIVALFFPMHLALAWALALPQIAPPPPKRPKPPKEKPFTI
jgi:membrane-associated HD superfamily phosphohydrolase